MAAIHDCLVRSSLSKNRWTGRGKLVLSLVTCRLHQVCLCLRFYRGFTGQPRTSVILQSALWLHLIFKCNLFPGFDSPCKYTTTSAEHPAGAVHVQFVPSLFGILERMRARLSREVGLFQLRMANCRGWWAGIRTNIGDNGKENGNHSVTRGVLYSYIGIIWG